MPLVRLAHVFVLMTVAEAVDACWRFIADHIFRVVEILRNAFVLFCLILRGDSSLSGDASQSDCRCFALFELSVLWALFPPENQTSVLCDI